MPFFKECHKITGLLKKNLYLKIDKEFQNEYLKNVD